MPISTHCPQCKTAYNVPDAQLGKRVRCKNCEEIFTVAREAGPATVEPVPVEPVEPPMVTAAEAVTVSAVSFPPRRPRRPIRRREEPKESSGVGGVVIAGVVVLGTLLVLGGAATGAYFLFIRTEYDKQPAAVPGKPVDFSGMFNPPIGDDASMGPEAAERLSYEAKDIDQPNAGPKTFHPEAPVPAIAAAGTGGADNQLAPEVLKKVKAATAFLRVGMADGNQGEGTGFFALEPGVLVTNAHVVGMMQPNSGKPKRLDVILNSGEKDERTLTGTVLGVDRRADLAVLSIKGENLPEPLRVDSSRGLHETQPVFVSGFPLGSIRSKNISITPTAVDSLHKEEGLLERVQVRGAMLPGNSGGPVVDQRGNVIGVSVAMMGGQDGAGRINNTNINFAVPSDKVHYLLHGRLTELRVGYPFSSGSDLKVSIVGELFDPRGHVKQARMEWWIGDAGLERDASVVKPEAKPGDEPRKEAALRITGQRVTGEVVLPPLPMGKVYWLQAVLAGKGGESPRWASAVSYVPPPPLQARPVTLTKKPADSGQSVDVASRSSFSLTLQGMTARGMSLNLHAKLDEDHGAEGVTRQFTAINVGVRMSTQSATRGEMRRNMHQRIQGAGELDVSRLPAKSQDEARAFGNTIQGFVNGLEVPIPPTELKPQQTWTETRMFVLDHLIESGSQQAFDMKYTYLGVRTGEGGEEAVIGILGTASGNASAKGTIRGTAWVDVATGTTKFVRATIEYELSDQTFNAMMGSQMGSISGKVDVRLHRPADKDAKLRGEHLRRNLDALREHLTKRRQDKKE